ncbi:DUF6282 family protein [Pseudonocardia xishanensis]|uniref:DUF6282 family protein n=1 Tax=Pseudonocardia xishanensis TaxID=630995 RepID=A0ABP8RXI3_9PSEU
MSSTAVLDADLREPDPEVDELLVGAVDLHVHPGPSPFPRRIGILGAARDAAAAGFSAMVVKSHHLSMQTDVLALRDAGLAELPIDVYSGVALNRTVGGLNPYIVELILKLGGRVVWFPTISSAAHIQFHHDHHDSRFPTSSMALLEHEPLPILDDAGRLLPVAQEILEIIAAEEAVLNCGHLSAPEIDVLVAGARAAGIHRIVISHPTFIVGASAQRCGEWARQGALIEHCLALAVNRPASPLTQEALQPYLDECGVGGTIFSSDLGQAGNILPVTGYRRMVRRLLDHGVPADDVRAMVGGNARTLLEQGGN